MEEHFVLAAELTDLFDGLNCADLVVHVDDRADESIWSDSLLEDVELDKAVSVHRQVGHLEALIFEVAARVEHALMVDLGGDDVTLLIAIEAGKAFQAQIVRLCGSRGEYDLLAGGTDEGGDLLAGLLARLLGLPAKWMRS